MQEFAILEPPSVPIAGMRSAPHPSLLAPGEQALIQNFRWGETGALVVRAGIAQLFGVPDASAVSVIDIWAGELNGNQVYAMAVVCVQGATGHPSAITSASPALVTQAAHGYQTGQWVYLAGATGLSLVDSTGMQVNGSPNTAQKGLWQINVVDGSHYSLNGSTSTGALTGAPTAQIVKTRIYASVNNAALTEITSEGNACFFGGSPASTRFPNLTSYFTSAGGSVGGVARSSSTKMTFTAIRTPNGLDNGNFIQPVDVLLISNGIDSVRVWNPSAASGMQLALHDPLSLPANALTTFAVQSTFAAFAQAAGPSGKSYDTDGVNLNAQPFNLSDSNYMLFKATAITTATPAQVTVANHGFTTGDGIQMYASVGMGGIVGDWVITVVDANNFTLNGSTSTGAFTSASFLRGPGPIVITAATATTPIELTTLTPHLFHSGDYGFVTGIGTLAGGEGIFQMTVVDATHLKLNGSTGTGAAFAGTASLSYSRYGAGSQVPMLYAQALLSSTSFEAAVRFSAPLTIASQLIMIVDGVDPISLLSRCKVEVSPDNVATHLATNWFTVTDPISQSVPGQIAAYPYTDPVPPMAPVLQAGSISPTLNRYIVAFPIGNLVVNQIVRHIRFTFGSGGAAPNFTSIVNILGIMSAGGYPGSTQWAIAYEDTYSQSESFGIEASSITSTALSSVGGPAIVSTPIPPLEAIGFDYVLSIPSTNVAGGVLSGGLNKNPSAVTIYMRLPGASAALYAFHYDMLVPVVALGVAGWVQFPGTDQPVFQIFTAQNLFFTKALADPTRPLPPAFQIPIPPANTMVFASSRLFVGDVWNADSGERTPSDLYFSAANQPFRLGAVPVDAQGNYDPAGPSRCTFVAEAIENLVASSSMAEAASYVYVYTTTALHMIGGGGIMGALTDATSLGSAHRIGATGTQCPQSVQERNGVIVWVDNEFCGRRMYGGVPQDITRKRVNDKLVAITAVQRRNVVGIWTRDRCYLLLGNSTMLVWHEPSQQWESLDLLPVNYLRLAVLYDPVASGSGRKLLGVGADMKTYWHETGTTDLGSNVAVQIDTRQIGFGRGMAGTVSETMILSDSFAGTLTVNSYYEPFKSEYSSTCPLSTGFGTDLSSTRTELVAPPDPDTGERGVYLRQSITGALPGGTTLLAIISKIGPVSSTEASVI